MSPILSLQKFQKSHFPTYLSWFADPDLKQQLGPMEEEDEWLEDALTAQDGCTYSVFQNNELVAVLGIVYPVLEHPYYFITNIAVNPGLRSQGIGQKALKELMKLHPLKAGESWRAGVDEKNPRAKAFFEQNGWKCISEPPQNNDMYVFEYR